MLKKVASAVIMSVCLQSAFANESTPKPDLCPSIKSIQAVGVNDAAQLYEQGAWFGFNESSFYDTADEWSFVAVGEVKAEDKDDAILQYNKQLGLLTQMFGPEEGREGGWACYYVDSFEDGEEPSIVGIALTPVIDADTDDDSKRRKNMMSKFYQFKKFGISLR